MATTKEPVDEALTKIGREDLGPDGREAWRDLCACVTAMKHERDEARRLIETPHDGSPMQRERDALRERVQVLEAEQDLLASQHDNFRERALTAEGEMERLRERAQALEAKVGAQREHMREMKTYQLETATRAEKAESRLAAIRQRAGDSDAMVDAAAEVFGLRSAHLANVASAVARYILGPDATEVAPICSHCRKRPAVCIGEYERDTGDPQPACNECCGHGNEDGWCRPLDAITPVTATEAAQEPETAADRARKFDEALGGKRFVSAIDEAEPMSQRLTERSPRVKEEAEALATSAAVPPSVDADVSGVRGGGGSPVTHEPTTAEAFATVRDSIGLHQHDDVGQKTEAFSALSLLERRMTTIADALRHIQRWCNHDRGGTEMPETLQIKVNAALTDAPAVFTLEEIEAAMRTAGVAPLEREETLDTLRGARRAQQ